MKRVVMSCFAVVLGALVGGMNAHGHGNESAECSATYNGCSLVGGKCQHGIVFGSYIRDHVYCYCTYRGTGCSK